MALSSILIAVWWLMPAVIWIGNACVFRHRRHWVVPFLAAAVIGYVILMFGTVVREFELEQAIERLRRLGETQTAEAQRLMKEQQSDTGRSLAPVIGIPLTLAWTALSFGILALVEWSYRADFRIVFGRRGNPLDK